jgi:predicted lipase
MTAIRDMIWNHQPKSIFVTGHSLGGVLAVFAAIEIKRSSGFLGKIYMYTYGQPRIGNN